MIHADSPCTHFADDIATGSKKEDGHSDACSGGESFKEME